MDISLQKSILLKTFYLLILCFSMSLVAQTDDEPENEQKSVIQTYTPSVLLEKGKWDIKWFNNLYTETKNTVGTIPRNNFFTSILEIYTGISESRKWNIGLLLDYRSNTINADNPFSLFQSGVNSRSGITSIAPAIKVAPFSSIPRFSIVSAFHIPLFKEESMDGVFLDQKGFTWQNRIFYDYTFPGDKFQLFTELNTELNFGDKMESFANNSLGITPGVFISYFPSSKFTILALVQHFQRIDLGDSLYQNFTTTGAGIKYQLTQFLNLELLYTKFLFGKETGLGETFNLGFRALF